MFTDGTDLVTSDFAELDVDHHAIGERKGIMFLTPDPMFLHCLFSIGTIIYFGGNPKTEDPTFSTCSFSIQVTDHFSDFSFFYFNPIY